MPLVKKAQVVDVPSIPSTAAAPVSTAEGAKKLAQDVVAATSVDCSAPIVAQPRYSEKDNCILAQCAMKAVVGSVIYGHQCSLMDEKEIDGYLAGKMQFWMDKVRELSRPK